MKKFICVIVILAIMLGAGIAEIVMTSGLFKDINAKLIEVKSTIQENKDDLFASDAESQMKEIMDKWNKSKNYALMFSNHTVVRTLDEKLVSLNAYVECGEYADAHAYCEISIELSEDLIDETYPVLTNLF